MFVKSLLASVLATTALAATLPRDEPQSMGCGNEHPTEEQLAGHKKMAVAEYTAAMLGTNTSPARRSDIYIDTYVHVVSDSTAPSSWYLSRDTINKQIAVLNQDFRGTGFQYVLRDVDWTINSYWAFNQDEYGMKTSLHRGNYGDLNLYYITDIGPNHTNTGHCPYPVRNASGDTISFDGCVMSAWTTPGGDSRQFSTGRITTHEVGHWHNLIHTFDGYNCNGWGDYVDDTPSESKPSSGCPTGRDTCPSPGLDPIHNHMDYSDDYCRTEFTPGQIARMQSSWNAYRA
ncbi:hypothetical protein PWT90_09780 [Aphanocladium album]|nr:hypothetical protein PWT90_09780 [Aphanocladium album]